MKEIILTQGKVAVIDDCDLERVSKYSWCYNGKYAVLGVIKNNIKTTELLHRFILNPSEYHVVDHIDNDPLNNRRSNLRICTQAYNVSNGNYKPGVSGYRGVTLDKRKINGKCYFARIRNRAERIHLGNYFTVEEAAIAYNIAALHLFGESFRHFNDVPGWRAYAESK